MYGVHTVENDLVFSFFLNDNEQQIVWDCKFRKIDVMAVGNVSVQCNFPSSKSNLQLNYKKYKVKVENLTTRLIN